MQLRGLELNFRVKLFCCKICRYCKYILQPNCKTQFQLQEQQKANILFLNSFVQNWLALVHKTELENIFVLFWFYDLCRPKTWRVLILKSYLDIIFFAKMHLILLLGSKFIISQRMLPAPATLDTLPFCNLVIPINSDYNLSGPRPQNSQLKTKGQCKLMIVKRHCICHQTEKNDCNF